MPYRDAKELQVKYNKLSEVQANRAGLASIAMLKIKDHLVANFQYCKPLCNKLLILTSTLSKIFKIQNHLATSSQTFKFRDRLVSNVLNLGSPCRK